MAARVGYADDSTIPRIIALRSGCWLWTGPTYRGGYGRWRERGIDRDRPAHTIMYETMNETIVMPGETLDHLCRFTTCVNPAHLELVNNGENARRGNYGRKKKRR